MKIISTLILAAILTATAQAQDATPDQVTAITTVIGERVAARTNAVVPVKIPFSAVELARLRSIAQQAEQHGERFIAPTPLIVMQPSLKKYLADLQQIDVTKCPEDFRIAWLGYVHALENYNPANNLKHEAVAGVSAGVAIKADSTESADLYVQEVEEVTSKDDCKFALEKVETCAVKYGVQFLN
jgi:hypothetical protein